MENELDLHQSASEILLDVINPRKIIRELVIQRIRELKKRIKTDLDLEAGIENIIQIYTEEIMSFYTPVLLIREKATVLLDKGRIYVDSNFYKTALKMRQEVVSHIEIWLEKHSGKSIRVPFNQNSETTINAIDKNIHEQKEFLLLVGEKQKNAKEIKVNVPTHNPESKHTSREDGSEITIAINENGQILSMEITEKFSYTTFDNKADEIPIYLLAKNFPEEILRKFDYGINPYATSNVSNCKIPLSHRLHDYGEQQLWINIYSKDNISNSDYLKIIRIWLELLKKFPRKAKKK